MLHLPVTLVTSPEKRALVVGGGKIAYAKIKWLRQFHLEVDVISPEVIEPIAEMAEAGTVLLYRNSYTNEAKNYCLVIAATNQKEINISISQNAQALGIPVNVVDQPELCTFHVPSAYNSGDLSIAVSTGGKSPSLAARIRREISALMPDFYGHYTRLLGQAREQLKQFVPDPTERSKINSALASRDFEKKLQHLTESEQEQLFVEEIDKMRISPNTSLKQGKVYLVGAGPGDEELITIKGVRILSDADSILFDGLVNKSLLKLCKDGAEYIDTSKRAGCANFSQEKINETMVTLAKEGKTVCRLKGGDPCIFARGGEEAIHLSRNNIEFEIVPGITSAIATLEYAGIPITHRDHASYFQVVTGHENPKKTSERINWNDIGQSSGTVIFLMGAHRLTEISTRLISCGRAPETPLVVISRGTLPDQSVFETTLHEASNKQFETHMDFPRPALIAIGDVISLRKELQWFNQ